MTRPVPLTLTEQIGYAVSHYKAHPDFIYAGLALWLVLGYLLVFFVTYCLIQMCKALTPVTQRNTEITDFAVIICPPIQIVCLVAIRQLHFEFWNDDALRDDSLCCRHS